MYLWFHFAVMAALLIGALAQRALPLAERTARRISGNADLPFVDSEQRAWVVSSLEKSDAAGLLGAFTTVTLVTPLLFVPVSNPTMLIWLVTLPAMLVGTGIGSAIGALRMSLQSLSRLRVAHLVPMRLRDYLPRTVIALIVVGIGAAVVLSIRAIALGGGGYLPASLVLTTIAIASAATGLVVARRVIARPQRASTSLELAWDDLFRTRTVRLGAGAIAGIVWVAIVAGITATIAEAQEWPGSLANAVVLISVIADGSASILPARYYPAPRSPHTS